MRHEIFGDTMSLWAKHMPRGMYLKSEGFASNLADPRGEHTLKRFCAEQGIEYGDFAVPIALDTFERYGRWFQERLVAQLRDTLVKQVSRDPGGYQLTLDSGQTLRARSVVLATGMSGYAHIPAELADLPPEAVVHTFEHREPELSRGATVAVIGAGQSAMESAALMAEHGAEVHLIARTDRLAWLSKPGGPGRPLRERWKYPESGLGEGRSQWFYSNYPLVFHFSPESKRVEARLHRARTGRRVVAARSPRRPRRPSARALRCQCDGSGVGHRPAAARTRWDRGAARGPDHRRDRLQAPGQPSGVPGARAAREHRDRRRRHAGARLLLSEQLARASTSWATRPG